MACDLDVSPGPSNVVRVGTWAFQSLELQSNANSPIEHQRYHDLESFYHVLSWCSLRHTRHLLPGPALVEVLQQVFNDSVGLNASFTKTTYMASNILTEMAQFQNEPLARLLKALGRKFRRLYIDGPEPRDEDSERAKALYAEDVKDHEEALMKLKSDREPKWAEDLVMEAICQPDSEWGDMSYYCHTLPHSEKTS
ncbi:hypothetical protein GALMADRAFT_156607 [Galerina marginata CBS 339.88]|uniref:Fungal-type protein kinase domain-containing protein n=1 Tax=Galerina marginata (strain CBS 339.88) TaxID=685588 RepID=A0A067SXF6_GALM3|nr:hypothetical protein GALMADRAFT_156607 [Galerina marginata CBS 339.88]